MSRKKSSRNTQNQAPTTVVEPEVKDEQEAAEPEVKDEQEAAEQEAVGEEPTVHLPSVEELLEGGYSEVTAERIRKAVQDQLDGGPGKLSPAYKISTPRKSGYWCMGRQFQNTPSYVWVDEVKDEHVRELESQDPRYLTVEVVEQPDER